jgi:hypothetical protein
MWGVMRRVSGVGPGRGMCTNKVSDGDGLFMLRGNGVRVFGDVGWDGMGRDRKGVQ